MFKPPDALVDECLAAKRELDECIFGLTKEQRTTFSAKQINFLPNYVGGTLFWDYITVTDGVVTVEPGAEDKLIRRMTSYADDRQAQFFFEVNALLKKIDRSKVLLSILLLQPVGQPIACHEYLRRRPVQLSERQSFFRREVSLRYRARPFP